MLPAMCPATCDCPGHNTTMPDLMNALAGKDCRLDFRSGSLAPCIGTATDAGQPWSPRCSTAAVSGRGGGAQSHPPGKEQPAGRPPSSPSAELAPRGRLPHTCHRCSRNSQNLTAHASSAPQDFNKSSHSWIRSFQILPQSSLFALFGPCEPPSALIPLHPALMYPPAQTCRRHCA
jgi:hypothetical protein